MEHVNTKGQHGGSRIGSGRPRVESKVSTNLYLKLDPDTMNFLKSLKKDRGMTAFVEKAILEKIDRDGPRK